MSLEPRMSVNEDSGSRAKAVWTRVHLEETASTNDVCKTLPPWSAVTADMQTRGRGRFGRAFVSGRGGLWLSASLPAPGPAEVWAGFSLRVGACLLTHFHSLGLEGARLRWPNDILCGPRKLAGLLIEQSASGSMIVGLGVNVFNEPWNDAPELRGVATRLVDWISPPDLSSLTDGVLEALAEAHRLMLQGGLRAAVEELNARWTDPVPVEIDLLGGGLVRGAFLGLAPNGHLQLLDNRGDVFLVEHPMVERLRELEA
jgi:BirA family transcriptional regulator, biotin operon repressor / biotin---[acetyl-CoA-carboxylase] ligase